MAEITEHGRQVVAQIAARHGIAEEAGMALLHALQKGHGTAAQFNHPALGGMGQWSQGGMIQIGEMTNDALKRKVAAACAELAERLNGRDLFDERNAPREYNPDGTQESPNGAHEPSGGASAGSRWWPDELGTPSATGGQNDSQYALFPSRRRLAVRQGGAVRVYDTGEHQITGFSQQQGRTLRFSSQTGQIGTDDLRLV